MERNPLTKTHHTPPQDKYGLNNHRSSWISLLSFLFMFFFASSTICLIGCVPKNEAERHFDNALAFTKLHMFSEAVTELKNGLVLYDSNPKFANSEYKSLAWGVVYLKNGENDKAEAEFKKALEINRKFSLATILLCSVYINEGKYDKADEIVKTIDPKETMFGEVYFVKGMRLFGAREYDEAIAEFKKALEEVDKNASALKDDELVGALKSEIEKNIHGMIALSYERSGDTNKALDEFRWILAFDQNNELLISKIFIVENKIKLEQDPNNAYLHGLLGWEYFKRGMLDEALSEYKRAGQLNPGLDSAQNNIGLILYQQKKYTEAASHFKKAIILNRNSLVSMNAHYNLGKMYRKSGKIDAAASEFNEALKKDPLFGPAKKEIEIVMLIKAVKRNAKNVQFIMNLGDANFINGDYSEAIDSYKKAVALGVSSSAVHNNLGMAYLRLKRFPEALAEFNLALEIDPDYMRSRYNLGVLYKQVGDLGKAVDCFKLVIGKTPRNIETMDNLAHTYFEMGRAEDAVREWTKLLKVDPKNKHKDRIEAILKVLG